MTDTRAKARDVMAQAIHEGRTAITVISEESSRYRADAVLVALEAVGLAVEKADLVEKLIDACGEKDHYIAMLEDMANNPPDLSAEDREQLARDLCEAWGSAWADTTGEAAYEHCADLDEEFDYWQMAAEHLAERWHITRRAGR